jgi:hypothetical protein
MGLSEATAAWLYNAANIALIVSLILGVLSTGIIVWSGNIKESYSNIALAKTNERAAIAEQKAAEAQERTAQIKQITAWRRITPEQNLKIAEAIRDKSSSIDVLIEYQSGDPESYYFALDIIKIFKESGVKKIRCIPNSYPVASVFGLHIANDPELDVSAIKEAFSIIGGSFFIKDLSKHLPSNNHPPNLYIFVAPKIPPNMVR